MPPSLIHLPATDPAADIAAVLSEHGGVIVDGILSRAVLDRFNAELDPLLAEVQPD